MPVSVEHDELRDRRRLAALTREHHAFLSSLARKLCRGNFDPEDLVQDVLEKTVAHFDALPADVNHAAWMARVMKNLFIDRVRAKASAPVQVELDAAPPAVAPPVEDAAWWDALTAADIRAAATQLAPELRDAFERFAFEGQSYKQIAAAMGVPVATVGTRVLRARRQLRGLLGGRDER